MNIVKISVEVQEKIRAVACLLRTVPTLSTFTTRVQAALFASHASSIERARVSVVGYFERDEATHHFLAAITDQTPSTKPKGHAP